MHHKNRLKAVFTRICVAALAVCCASSPLMAQNAKKGQRKKRAQQERQAARAEREKQESAKNELEQKAGAANDNKAEAAKQPAPDGIPATASATPQEKPAQEEIQVSFQGANIDMIVQWLAKTTGKSVMKHPRVQCQLTIVGSKKVPPREAVNLVYRALALEGFSVVESIDSILIVPEGQEPRLSPELLSSRRSDIPEGRQRLVKVFSLQHVQASEVRDKIKSLLSEKAIAEVDERSNQLIITDYTDNITVIGDLIDVLDADTPRDVSVRIIPLQNVSAQDLAKEISPLYQRMLGKSSKDAGSKDIIEVTANERSNSLIVLSSEANFRGIQRLVETLDTEEAQEKIMRTFKLQNADAQDVARQLQELTTDETTQRNPFVYYYSSYSRGSAKKVNVVADRRRNSIIVQAPPAQMENITKLVDVLDAAVEDDSLAPRIYPLKFVAAADIEDILNELFLKREPVRAYWSPFSSDSSSEVGRLYGKVRVTSEAHANALIVTANSAENLEAVEAVIKQLDVPSEAGETTMRVNLRFAKASTVANNLNILFARTGSPAMRTANPAQPNQNQNQQQNNSSRSNFELEQEAREEGYFPWLGGQPETGRSADGRPVRAASDLVGRVRVVPDHRSNSLLVSANVHYLPQVMKLVEELDVPTAQVLIEAKIVEVSSDFLDKLGVRWSPDGSRTFTAEDFDNSLIASTSGRYQKGFGSTTTVNTPSSANVAAALASLRSGTLDSSISMEFLVQFLKKTTDATVLAEPQINIADNETGKLFVGQQVPTLTAQNNPALGGTTQNFEYKDVGVILEVTPHINSSGDVALKIRAESSTIVPGQTLFGGAIFDTRNFKTDLTAHSGETLVLGGIIQRQSSNTLRKTPVLGSIPGVKWLFNKKDNTTREVELMVFLRPRVVRTPEEARALLKEVEARTPLISESKEKAAEEKGKSKEKPEAKQPDAQPREEEEVRF